MSLTRTALSGLRRAVAAARRRAAGMADARHPEHEASAADRVAEEVGALFESLGREAWARVVDEEATRVAKGLRAARGRSDRYLDLIAGDVPEDHPHAVAVRALLGTGRWTPAREVLTRRRLELGTLAAAHRAAQATAELIGRSLARDRRNITAPQLTAPWQRPTAPRAPSPAPLCLA